MAIERRLYRVARCILLNDADCEDAVQQALFKAWENRQKLRDESFFETWLTRILINVSRNMARARRYHAELSEKIPAPPVEEGEALAKLSALPETQRLAISLRYIEGYGVSEIADMTKVPAGTVKWRLYQGRKLLGKLLEEDEI